MVLDKHGEFVSLTCVGLPAPLLGEVQVGAMPLAQLALLEGTGAGGDAMRARGALDGAELDGGAPEEGVSEFSPQEIMHTRMAMNVATL
jgi:hypothetical protein